MMWPAVITVKNLEISEPRQWRHRASSCSCKAPPFDCIRRIQPRIDAGLSITRRKKNLILLATKLLGNGIIVAPRQVRGGDHLKGLQRFKKRALPAQFRFLLLSRPILQTRFCSQPTTANTNHSIMSKHVLVLGGHGKVSQLLTPLLLRKSWTVTSIIRAEEQVSTIQKLGENQQGRLNVLVRSIEDIKSESQAKSILDEVKPDYVVWSAGAGGRGGAERVRTQTHAS